MRPVALWWTLFTAHHSFCLRHCSSSANVSGLIQKSTVHSGPALLAKDQRLPTQMPCTCRNVQTSPQIAAQQRTKNFSIHLLMCEFRTVKRWQHDTDLVTPGSPFCARWPRSVIYGKKSQKTHPFRNWTRWLIDFRNVVQQRQFRLESGWREIFDSCCSFARRTLINLRIILANKFSD